MTRSAVTRIVQDVEALEAEEYGALVDTTEFLRDDKSFGFYPSAYPINLATDREGGQNFPYFQTEMELAMIRGVGRVIHGATEHGTSALDNLVNYVLCEGFQWNATVRPAAKADPAAKAAQAAVQQFLDEVCELNDWLMDRDDESILRACRDGEAFIGIFDGQNGLPVFRFIEPSQVTEPNDSMKRWLEETYGLPCGNWRFGVHTSEGDVETVYGYFVQWSQRDADFDYIPAERMVHIKRNVDRNVKRGISDFFPLKRTLPKTITLQSAMTVGASVQAKIAWILELPEATTQQQANDLVAGNASAQKRTVPGSGGQQRNATQYPEGTVLTTKAGANYKAGPMGAERNAGFIEVLQAGLRTIGIRWQMPEFMISGDASNANYASTIAAGTPFNRARKKDQSKFGAKWKELFVKAIAVAYAAGYFRELMLGLQQLNALVAIQCTVPNVETQSDTEAVQNAVAKRGLGVKASVLVQELGYDPETDMDAAAAGEAGGTIIPGQPGVPPGPSAPAAMSNLSTLQFRRNTKAISEVLQQVAAGQKSRVFGMQILLGLGVPQDSANVMLDDAADGKIDDPGLGSGQESGFFATAEESAAISGIVTRVADGSLPRDSAAGQLVTLWGLTQNEAWQVIGSAGTGEPSQTAAMEKALQKLWRQL